MGLGPIFKRHHFTIDQRWPLTLIFFPFLFRNHIDFHVEMLIWGRLFECVENMNKTEVISVINVDFGVGV